MIKRFLISVVLVLAVAFSIASSPQAFAQSVNGVNDGGLNQSQQGVGNTPVTQTQSSADGFNWLWILLPILAIAVVMVLSRAANDNDRTYYSDRGLAGMKGGEARGVHDDDEE